jgi:hypothetical protein
LTHGATGSKLKTWDEAEVALAPRDLDSFSKSQYPKKLLKSVSSPLAIGCSHVIHANLQGISVGV